MTYGQRGHAATTAARTIVILAAWAPLLAALGLVSCDVDHETPPTPGTSSVSQESHPEAGPTPADAAAALQTQAAVATERAVSLTAEGKSAEAEALFREAIRLHPERPEGHLNLANSLARQRRFKEAIPHYRRALELRPEYAKAHNNLAVALKETGQLPQAHRHLQEALRLRRMSEPENTTEASPFVASSADSPPELDLAAEPLDVLPTKQQKAQAAAQRELLDPRRDGWESEVAAEDALASLKTLTALLYGSGTIDADALAAFATDDVSCTALRPTPLEEVFRNAGVVVRRQARAAPAAEPALERGREALAKRFRELAALHAGTPGLEPHVKVVRVQQSQETVATTARFDVAGGAGAATLQVRTTWLCRWTREDGQTLRLLSIRPSSYEEVETSSGPWLEDATFAVLGKNPSFTHQLTPGLHDWLGRIGRVHHMHVFARYGMAVGDVNGDGLEDVYVCQPGGLPNRLYVQAPDGTCEDRSSAAGVDWLDPTGSALFVDLDNDGDQDLAAATIFGLILMENDATGRFERRAVLAPRDMDLHALSAADYDGDGDLDLYVSVDFSNRSTTEKGTSAGFVYHDANDGGANVLFRNDGPRSEAGASRWVFTDVTQEVGLDADNRRHSLAASWEDYDNDGDLDLYVANDYGRNCLYRNEDGHFTNVASSAGVVDFGSGMSVSWGDYDLDGQIDLYVGNMFSSAGNRITRQDRFQPRSGAETRAVYTRFAKGNSLFRNLGDGTFQEVGAETGVEMGRWAWSSIFADLNNDGLEDLLVANGYITTEDTGDL